MVGGDGAVNRNTPTPAAINASTKAAPSHARGCANAHLGGASAIAGAGTATMIGADSWRTTHAVTCARVFYPQLFSDVLEVTVRGSLRDEQARGDLAVGKSFRNHGCNLAFAC